MVETESGVKRGDGNRRAGQDEAEGEQNPPTAGNQHGPLYTASPVGVAIRHPRNDRKVIAMFGRR